MKTTTRILAAVAMAVLPHLNRGNPILLRVAETLAYSAA